MRRYIVRRVTDTEIIFVAVDGTAGFTWMPLDGEKWEQGKTYDFAVSEAKEDVKRKADK